MMSRAIRVSLASLMLIALSASTGCGTSPRGRDSEIVRPDQVVDFGALYSHNCAGCHGADGRGSAAIALANPVFLAIADDVRIGDITANGISGSSMPGFAQNAGGMLTDQQIGVLVRGIRSWAKPHALADMMPPPYKAQESGDPQRGAEAYKTYCSSCHGTDGRGGSKASSIVDGSYLALVSDHDLRIIVIAGRPELAAPDWRDDLRGQPMSEQEISDVVAWLSSQRPQFSGQQYSVSSTDLAGGEAK